MDNAERLTVIGRKQCGGTWGNITPGQRLTLPYNIAAELVAAGFAEIEEARKPRERAEQATREAPETRTVKRSGRKA